MTNDIGRRVQSFTQNLQQDIQRSVQSSLQPALAEIQKTLDNLPRGKPVARLPKPTDFFDAKIARSFPAPRPLVSVVVALRAKSPTIFLRKHFPLCHLEKITCVVSVDPELAHICPPCFLRDISVDVLIHKYAVLSVS